MDPGKRLQAAIARHRAGDLSGAIEGYKAVLAARPNDIDALGNMGIAFQSLGRREDAVHVYRQAALVDPNAVNVRINLGIALLGLGRNHEAESSLREAISINENDAIAHANLGLALHAQRRVLEAVSSCRRALELRPDFPEAQLNLGTILRELGEFSAAEACCRRAASLRPRFAEAHLGHGNALRDLGRLDDAIMAYGRALDARPDFADAYVNLATALRFVGRLAESERNCRRALALQPNLAEAHLALACTLREIGRLDDAETSCRRAIAIKGDVSTFHSNLGNILRDLGRIDEAVSEFETAIALDRMDTNVHRGLLMTIMYSSTIDPNASFQLHRRFSAAFEDVPTANHGRFTNSPDPARRIRIGYLSSDFRSHAAAANLLPLLRAHDRSKLELFLYSEVGRPDLVTNSFAALADSWRSTVGMGDRDVAAMIREDFVDILVVLAGRFDANRPLVCLYDPAPICISSHDVATSGLSSIDYLISDRCLTPRDTIEHFSERLLCLPSFYLAEMPNDLPCTIERSGPIVFGCFNNVSKVSDPVLALWGSILASMPESKLALRYRTAYREPSIRRRVLTALTARGARSDQVAFPENAASYRKHLEIYNEVDIALDTFPFSGSTTTFDALIMGVPVVTLPGWSMVSRWSASMLTTLKLTELIAGSPDDYIAIVRRLSADRPKLAALRASLRDSFARSPLCDARRKARQYERFYRAAWRRWCKQSYRS